MCREFGLTGDWRSQASQVVLPLLLIHQPN